MIGLAFYAFFCCGNASSHRELRKSGYDYVTGARSLSLADRPELRIDRTTIVGTNIQATTTGGAVGNYTNAIQNVSHAQVYSVEAAGNVGPVFVQGEYFWFDVERRPFPQPASSTVTGLPCTSTAATSRRVGP